MRVLAAMLALVAVPSTALAAFPADPPNDPKFDTSRLPNATGEQWDMSSPAFGFDRGISADRAWKITIGDGVTVADLDSGADFNHEDLASKLIGRGFDVFQLDSDATDDARFGHGTNTAGVIGAAGGNGKGIVGTAPGARILMVRVHDSYIVPPDRLAESIVYAADHGAAVASMSVGTTGNSPALRRAVAYAERKGMVLVAAMGNEFFSHREYPASYDGVIAVGGVTYDTAGTSTPLGVASQFEVPATFSNYGPHIDVAAPTVVPSTSLGNRYTTKFQGTSAATPHVAGVVALVVARARAQELTLSPGEIRQIIRNSAHDVSGGPYDLAAGWDPRTGYGRVDALGAVQAVAPGKIPPAADIVAPVTYSSLRAPAAVRARISARAYPVRWTLEAGAGVEPSSWQPLGSGTLSGPSPVAGTALGTVDPALGGGAGTTLRLRVSDAAGNPAEDRGFVQRLDDRAMAARYPLQTGASGEASPALAQLDGKPGQEIVLAGGDGIVRVISGRTGRELPGWPRALPLSPGFKLTQKAIGVTRPGVVGTPAIADIDGDGHSEIVVAGGDGSVSVFDRRGRMKRGFPVRIDIRRPPQGAALDAAILASPALGDLDGDGHLDIVVGAADQHIYAWNARGKRLRGWPVLARDGDTAKILSSPAIGDIDGDGKLDVVEGTAEVFGDTPQGTGRVYAFSADGKRKPGWPVKPDSFLPNALPLAGEGVPTSPTLADVDGDGSDEVAIAAVAGEIQLYRGNGSRMGAPHFSSGGPPGSSNAVVARAFVGNGAFGRLRPGGPLRYFSGEIDGRIVSAGAEPGLKTSFDHLIGGWDARSGALLPAFPRRMEGWFFLNAPALADVDGDGRAEIVVGSSGGLVHAFHEDGTEAAGWPRDTGSWLIASPAVGDVDGDGLSEVVQPTRDGSVYVWDTPARARANEWPYFRHDQRNTGRWTPPRPAR